jgi:molybdopterin-guanine dinucleotide biosynthesis protein A
MQSAPFPLASTITLAILAGGEGSRMGQPKGLLRIQGKPILEYQLERLNWPGPKWLITAPGRGHPPGWESFDREISDPVSGLGPLRGVLSGLQQLTGELLLIGTVDMPGLKRDHLEWLVAQMKSESQIGIMCRRHGALVIPHHPNPLPGDAGARGGAGTGGIVEPFPMLLRKESVVSVRHRIESGRLSVHGLLEEPGFEAVETPAAWGKRAWGNLNYPEDIHGFLENME